MCKSSPYSDRSPSSRFDHDYSFFPFSFCKIGPPAESSMQGVVSLRSTQSEACRTRQLESQSSYREIIFRLRFIYKSKKVTCITLATLAQQLKNENLCKLVGSKRSSILRSILHSERMSQVKVIILSSEDEIETT